MKTGMTQTEHMNNPFTEKHEKRTEELLEKPCWVIDFLPRQVPAGKGGQYFSVEAYYRRPENLPVLYRKFADLILKLNCYCDLVINEGISWEENPDPEKLYRRIIDAESIRFMDILIPSEDSLITLSWDDLYMSVYHPSAELLETVRDLAASEGLFVRPAAE